MLKRAKFAAAIKRFGGGKRGLRSLAFVIRRNIGKRGIPSNPRFDKRFFFKKAEQAIRREFPNELARLGAVIQTSWEREG